MINTIIDNKSSINDVFELVINYFDPFRSRNHKTRVLDMTHSYYWSKEYFRLYDVTKTNNIKGTASDRKYNIIVYEPPQNKNFENSIIKIKNFCNLLYKDGILIIKITDFKLKGKLKGSFDICKYIKNFYLQDNIIYKHKQSYTNDLNDKGVKIIHSNFMIFKME